MRRTLSLLLAVGLSLLLAAPARAALADRLLSDFADDGVIDACKYSENDLGHVKDLIANDIDSYEPDFRTAVDAMIEKRAQGGCASKKQPGGGASAATATPGSSGSSSGPSSGTGAGAGASRTSGGGAQRVPGPGQTPAPSPLIGAHSIAEAARADDPGGTPPFPLIAIGVLLALLALGALVFGTARWIGWQPAWAGRARHAAAEAGSRASSTWAEFTDFVRFGR